MHEILRWPKIRTIQFLFNFGSKYQSSVKILRWPTFLVRKPWDGSKFGLSFSRNRFNFELWAISGFCMWLIFQAEIKEKLNCSNFEPSQDFMHMPSRAKIFFDDFLGHLRVPSVLLSSPISRILNLYLVPNYCNLDVTKFVDAGYNYKIYLQNAQKYDYLRFNAPDFNNDILIGFSNDFSGHDDSKWEIVIGGWEGLQHVIRDGNLLPPLVKKLNANR